MIKTIIIFILLNVFIFANEKQDSIPEKKMNILSYSPKIAFAYGNSTITNQNYPQLVDYNTNLNEMNGIEIAFSYDRRFPKDSLGNYSKLFWGVSLGYGMYSAKYISFENFRSVYTDNGPLLLEESNNIDLDFNVFSIAPKITYMVIEDEKYFFTIGFLPLRKYVMCCFSFSNRQDFSSLSVFISISVSFSFSTEDCSTSEFIGEFSNFRRRKDGVPGNEE